MDFYILPDGSPDKNRDNYMRCVWCGELFHHAVCKRDLETDAYLCPNQCVKPFIQPAYELPTPEN